ncbi:putative ribonuclease H-like domain-containing protein [Tanacetum coccineum]
MVPRTVLARSGLISLNAVRLVNTVQPRTTMNNAGPMKNVINNAYSTARKPFNKITTPNNSNFNKRVNIVNDKNVIAARPNAVVNTARPKAVLSVVKGNKGNTIMKKLMEDSLPLEVISKERKLLGKKNSVLFTNTECVVLSPYFKLTDESHVLLKVPRKDNMYSVDLKNVVPQGGLTCLLAKATPDESNLCHRRLEHVNFKTMNKLVKGNLVRGLPSKLFEINQTCVACQKGKQHRASCKTKTVSSISQPLQMLHMDLFGPTFVKSLMKKMYCLVVTDNFSRFSWVFFLATKDETSEILKTFIIGIENLIDLRVKVIRCDNRTKFKNEVMNQFCEIKGIKREFSFARTPQQNGVAERKNRTLVEATRTMLADSKFPTTFWAEEVNIACYVQNGVLVIKPQNKTPYELFLGKFDGKVDEGFFVGYSTNSKAFRVFNSRTRIVEENLHVKFSKDTPNIAGSGPSWLFDIHALTNSMNYKPVVARNQSTFSSSLKDSPDAGFKPSKEEEKKDTKDPGNEDNNVVAENIVYGCANDPNMPELEEINRFSNAKDDISRADMNNLDTYFQVSSVTTTRIHKDHLIEQIIRDLNSAPQTRRMTRNLEERRFLSTTLEQRRNHKDFQNCLFACFLSQEEPKKVWTLMDLPNGKRAIGTKWVYMNKKDERVARIEAISLFLAYASYKDFVVYQMDVKSAFLYGKIKVEVYVCQPPGFEDPDFPDRVYKVEKALYGLHQAPRAWKKMCTKFEKLMHKKFQMSSIGELTFFLGLQVKQKEHGIFISQDKYLNEILNKFGFSDAKTARTPMETQKALLKDADSEDVDEHLYRSMIGSLMYLTSLRPDIMFATKIRIDNESTICIVKNPIFYSKTKHIEIRHHFIRDSNEKKLIHMIKIHTDQNVTDLLTKAFDVIRFEYLIEMFLDKQVEGMSKHKKIYVTSSHTKKVFANMKRQGKDFSGRDTPLFPTMIVQAQEQEGEGSVMPTVPQHTPTINQPSSSQPQKKQKPRKSKKQNTMVSQPSDSTEPIADEAPNDENVTTDSNDPLLSENTKTSQAAEITKLKERVKKLEMRNKSRTLGLKRLRKVGRTARIESYEDEGLGDQEDASKHGRKIADIDADKEEVEVEKVVSTAEVTTASATTAIIDELTLAQTLIEIKAAKPKVVTTSATTTTTTVSRPKARGVVVQEPNYELAARLQAQEQEELTIEERSKMFVELMDKRKKHFARLRVEEQRRNPPTKAQKINTMSTYLKNMAGYKHNQLKTKIFKDIQMLFDKAMTRVNTFIDIDTELVKGSETRTERSSKRAGEELDSENLKKQKLDENVEAEVDDEAEMKKHMEIVPNDEVAIDAIPLATKPPIIVDWKIIKEGNMGYFQIIKADGSSKRYSSMIKMLQNIDREDLETLWKLVKAKHGITRPEEAYERVL